MKHSWKIFTLILLSTSMLFAQGSGVDSLRLRSAAGGSVWLLLPQSSTQQYRLLLPPSLGTSTNQLMWINGATGQIALLPPGTTGQVLQIGAGSLNWVDPSSIIANTAWSLTGNSGTNPAVNFLGTTDNQPIIIRTNNSERMRIDANGRIGIGTSTPARPVSVFTTSTDPASLIWLEAPNLSGGGDVGYGVGTAWGAGTSGFFNWNYGGGSPFLSIETYSASRPIRLWGSEIWIPTGNVGIGTTSPAYKLDVNGIIRAAEYRFRDATDQSGGTNFYYSTGTGKVAFQSNEPGGMRFTTINNTPITFETNNGGIGGNNERLRITGDGNIGIGTTSPSHRLHVAAASDPLRLQGLQTDNTLDQVLVADASGVVKRRSASSLASSTAWSLTGNSGTNPATNFLGTTDNQPLIIRTNNTERLRVTESGNVGIGTTAPSNRLHIEGGNLRIRSATNYNLLTFISPGWDPTAFVITTRDDGLVTGIPLSIDASRITLWGNVGIGTTTPGAKLDIPVGLSTPAFSMGPGGDGGRIWTEYKNGGPAIIMYDYDDVGGGIYFRESPTTNNETTPEFEAFIIGRRGNVGIGTTSPSHRLHVAATSDPLRLEGLQTDNTLDQVLVANASGVVRLRSVSSLASSTAWSLTGNSGTNPATNFLGTTDNQPLIIRTNNSERVRVTTQGFVGINESSPYGRLDVNDIARQSPIAYPIGGGGNAHQVLTLRLGLNSRPIIGIPVGSDPSQLSVAFGAGYEGNYGSSFEVRTDVMGAGSSGYGALGQALVIKRMSQDGTLGSIATMLTTPSDLGIVAGGYSPPGGAAWSLSRMVIKSNGDVGIGTTSPTQRLHVVATSDPLRLEGLQTDNTLNQVLVADASGVVKLRSASSLASSTAWSLTGNSGTNPATNFLGTTDYQVLAIRTNNTERMRINADGNIGIGTTAPAAPLDIQNFGNAALFSIGGGGTAYSLLNLRPSNGSNNRSVISIGTIATQPLLTFGAGYEGLHGTSFEIRSDIMGAGAAGAGYSNLSQALVIKRQSTDGTTESVATMITAPATLALATGYTLPGGASWSNTRLLITPTGNIGIGTTSPSQRLHVAAASDPLRLEGLQTDNTLDQVLVANASGVVKLRSASSLASSTAWSLTGNSGTNPSSNFLGTTDNQPLVIRTNNTEQVRIDPTGNVGIGTPNPGAKLEVKAGMENQTNPVEVIRIWGPNQPPNANSAQDIRWRFAAAGSVGIRAYRGGSWDTYLQFLTNAYSQGSDNPQVRMHINHDGNVGIGTTSPSQRLHVVATIDPLRLEGLQTDNTLDQVLVANASGVVKLRSASTLASSTAWSLTGNSGTNPATNFLGTTDNQPLVVRTNNTERVRVTPTGRVGIGTSSPSALLHLSGNNSANSASILLDNTSYGFLAFRSNAEDFNYMSFYTPRYSSTGPYTRDNAPWEFGLWTANTLSDADRFYFGRSGVSASDLVINRHGNVGINVATPSHRLHVVAASDPLRLQGLQTDNTLDQVLVTDASGVVKRRSASSLASSTAWSLTGNSGTNPSSNFLGTTDNQPLAIRTNNIERARFTQSGEVGIGTASPLAALHIHHASGLRLSDPGGDGNAYMTIKPNIDVSTLNPGMSSVAAQITNRNLAHLVIDIQANDPHDAFAVRTDADMNGTVDLIAMVIKPSGNIGFGTINPTNKFHVAATTDPLRVEGLQTDNTLDQVLVADASGVVKLRSASTLASSTAWSLTGNSGTTPSSNFLGTTDNQPLAIRTNNSERVRITETGYVGIGTTAPGAKLSLGTDQANTKLAIYDGGSDQYGFGIQGSQFRIHLGNSGARFSFLNAPAGTEILTIMGSGNVGIGNTSPSARLHVSGGDVQAEGHLLLRNTDNTARELRLYEPSGAGAEYTAFRAQAQGSNITYTLPASLTPTTSVAAGILQTDASGNLSWVDPSSLGGSSGWQLSGNTITSAWNGTSGSFLGTTNTQPLVIATTNTATPQQIQFWAGNQQVLRLNPAGTTAPAWSIQRDVGGNTRGLYAVDLQVARALATQVASGNYSVIAGGVNNTASGQYSVVAGGHTNTANYLSVVAGGQGNSANSDNGVIGGGGNNTISNQYGVIGGGLQNTVSGYISTIAGGQFNTASNQYSAIGGGYQNTASGQYSVVAGGQNNTASSQHSVVTGGLQNVANSPISTVAGGQSNQATGIGSTIAGGQSNQASGIMSAIAGGANNIVNGDYSAIPGGYNLRIGTRSFGFSGQTSSSPTNLSSVSNIAAFVDVDMWLYNVRNQASQLRLYEPSGAGTNYTAFRAQAQAADIIYTLPPTLTPTTSVANGLLQTDGSGNLSWVDPSSVVSSISWSLTGNSGTNPATNFLGTTDYQPLVIRTNNQERMRISEDGNVRIVGSQYPKLHIETNSTGSTPGDSRLEFLGNRASGNAALGYIRAFNKSYSGTDDVVRISMNRDNADDAGMLQLMTKPTGGTLTTRVTINSDGNVIIGDQGTIPLSTYNTGDEPSFIVAGENRDVVLASFSSSDAAAKADIEFFRSRGTPSSPANIANNDLLGQIGFGMYHGGNMRLRKAVISAAVDGNPGNNDYPTRLEFYTTPDGSANEQLRLVIKNNGNVGIGLSNPTYQLQLSTDQAAKTSTNTWIVASDARLKTVIGHYTKGLRELLQLNPVLYRYRNTAEYQFDKSVLEQTNIGFVAQHVQQIFPEAITVDKHGYLGLNIHPILIAYLNAFKELDSRIATLEGSLSHSHNQTSTSNQKSERADLYQRIEQLERQIERLERTIQHLMNEKQPMKNPEPWLGDNIPNPHDGTTTIPYFIPQGITSAILRLSNLKGEILLEASLPSRGQPSQITISITNYPSGSYDYSLILDGQVVSTKQMQLIK